MIPPRLRWLVEPGSPARQLGERFNNAGYRLFLVGGSVRDAFLDRNHEDLDFATDALPATTKDVLSGWADAIYPVGEIYGTIGALKGELRFEVTTLRAEVYREESRKPHVAYTDDIQTDLSRRDFTVNAIALEVPELAPIDPFGGLADLAGRSLRTPLAPEVSFSDDPLRMLRLFRFQATLDFIPDAEAVASAMAMGDRLEIVSAERIRDELSKLLVAPAPSVALTGLVDTGLLVRFLPELPALAMEQDPVHRHKDVLAHTLAVVDKTSPRLELRLAALLHDIGKPATRSFGAKGASFHHHEVVGAKMARARLRHLHYPRTIIDHVNALVSLHLRPHTLPMGWTDSAVRRYVTDAGPYLDDLNELVRCDVTTANPKRAGEIQQRIDDLEGRISELSVREELSRLRPPIDGHRVMELLGIGPGPQVGEIMDLLYERRIEEGPYSEEEATRFVLEWAQKWGIT